MTLRGVQSILRWRYITLTSRRCQYFAKMTHSLTINERKTGRDNEEIKLFWNRHRVVIFHLKFNKIWGQGQFWCLPYPFLSYYKNKYQKVSWYFTTVWWFYVKFTLLLKFPISLFFFILNSIYFLFFRRSIWKFRPISWHSGKLPGVGTW